jgi:hypothetical protein
MRSRWLDQVTWLERKAKQCQQRYYALRMLAIVGGVVVPALVSLNVRNGNVASAIAWTTFAVSLVVATAVAVEEFFHYGERWRNYRRSAEDLKSRGWQFFQLAGDYAGRGGHGGAFVDFAAAVERAILEEVDVYVTRVTRERPRETEPAAPAEPAAG